MVLDYGQESSEYMHNLIDKLSVINDEHNRLHHEISVLEKTKSEVLSSLQKAVWRDIPAELLNGNVAYIRLDTKGTKLGLYLCVQNTVVYNILANIERYTGGRYVYLLDADTGERYLEICSSRQMRNAVEIRFNISEVDVLLRTAKMCKLTIDPKSIQKINGQLQSIVNVCINVQQSFNQIQ